MKFAKKLNEQDVIEILLSDQYNEVLAERFGVTRQCISSIRNGITWKRTAPEIPRIPIRVKESVRHDFLHKKPNCQNCTEWNGSECSFGFPEAIDEPYYAIGCDFYKRNQSNP